MSCVFEESIERLPFEVLQYIFVLAKNPDLALVSRTFHHVATSQTSVKTQWLMKRYNNDCERALSRGLKWKFFNKDVLNQLDLIYSRLNGQNFIPYENRPIPQWFFKEPDPTGRIYNLAKILLLERHASPNESNGYPIIQSARLGRIEMVKLLIEAGAKVDIQDNMALAVSVRQNNIEMVKLLLKHGAKPVKSILKNAIEKGFTEMVQLLLENGAEVDASIPSSFYQTNVTEDRRLNNDNNNRNIG
ncbi:35693_t:CDS:1 [Gigaspora margarita]|uniref:Ankyrin repeat protein n=2 Tax=Gigaspora margarita TaxID=4874 RepID=A0A8H3X084_GIGMA|nr:ankyrin repeat protein [Gigaspora margarita]CAG8750976.1 35693_t:CDS:1 [Gigaspora margarita]